MIDFDMNWMERVLKEVKVNDPKATFRNIIAKLRRNLLTPDDIRSLLIPHAKEKSFPLDKLDLEVADVCSWYVDSFPLPLSNRAEMETESYELYKPIRLGEFIEQETQSIDWIIENILPKGGVGILAGPAGYGKSWMLLDLAIACGYGGLWLGKFEVPKGTVLYIDEESSNALLHKRLKKMVKAKEIDKDILDVHFLVGQGLCFNDELSVCKLRGIIQELKPRVIIIDSLIRVHRSEENSAKEMSAIFAIIKNLVREFQCTFLFADHQRKPNQFGGGSLDVALRGSTEKTTFVDTLLSLKRKDKMLIVEHSKSRFSEATPAFMVMIEDVSSEATSIRYIGESIAHLQEERLKKAHDFLITALNNNEWVSRKSLVVMAKKIEIPEKILDEALKDAVETELLEREDRKSGSRGGKSAFYHLKQDEEITNEDINDEKSERIENEICP
jgi:hypothetical protein